MPVDALAKEAAIPNVGADKADSTCAEELELGAAVRPPTSASNCTEGIIIMADAEVTTPSSGASDGGPLQSHSSMIDSVASTNHATSIADEEAKMSNAARRHGQWQDARVLAEVHGFDARAKARRIRGGGGCISLPATGFTPLEEEGPQTEEARELRAEQDARRRSEQRADVLQSKVEALQAELAGLRQQAEIEAEAEIQLESPGPSGESLKLPQPSDDASGASDKWNLVSWLQGANVHLAIAAAILRPLVEKGLDEDSEEQLRFVRALKERSELDGLLRTEPMLQCLGDIVWQAILQLKGAGAATATEMQDKFVGATTLSYAGLDKFFGGLEGIVGAPSPKLFEAMANEHTNGPKHREGPGSESTDNFITGNYGVETDSNTEWHYVTDEGATPQEVGREQWPAESEEKMPDRNKCRKKVSIEALRKEKEAVNKRLEAANQTPVMDQELIAACMYTGPMFVKYNAVLRGLQASESNFLCNTMIQLCCPADVFQAYIGDAKIFAPANGSLPFEEALRSLNKYTTTVHGINSAVIKLGKLTKARKVYRGVAGMALPVQFWQANAFDVKGGVEPAFMSTTLEQSVAMGYAAGDGSRMGLVIQVRQGMVNRGADISWLSQYSFEQEILFPPLTGIEVLRTYIQGSVVVIECEFSINLSALTLEQVTGKRKKLIADMGLQMAVEVRRGCDSGIADAAERMVNDKLEPLLLESPESFNVDVAFKDAVGTALQVKLDVEIAATIATTAEGLAEAISIVKPLQSSVVDLSGFELAEGGAHATMVAKWLHSKPATLTKLTLDAPKACMEVVNTLLQLVASTTTLVELDVKQGQSLNILQLNGTEQVESLDLSRHEYGPHAVAIIGTCLQVNSVLTECSLLKNNLNIESAKMLAKIGTEKRIMLSGIKHDQTEADLSNNFLKPADGILIASDLMVTAVLTSLELFGNRIGNDGAIALADALKSGKSVLTSLNLKDNNIRNEGAAAIAEALKSGMAVLTNLNLADNALCGVNKYHLGTYNPSGIYAIAAALEGSSVLKSLNLADNRLCGVWYEYGQQKGTYDASGIKALSDALASGKAVLKKLVLTTNSIKDEGAIALGESLKTNSTLETLELINCDIGAEGAKAIGAGLAVGIAVLTDLDLSRNKIGSTGAKAIAEALQSGMAVLTDLNLAGNSIGPEGAAAIAQALKSGMAVLTTIDLRANNLDQDAKQTLTNANKRRTTPLDLKI